MDAAKDDRLAGLPLGGRLGELVAVALEVGVGDHAILLVMVAEDHQPRAHSPADRLDPLAEHGVAQSAVGGERSGRLRVGKNRGHDRVQYTGRVPVRCRRQTLYCRAGGPPRRLPAHPA